MPILPEEIFLDAFGQIFGNFVFRTPEHEGAHAGGEPPAGQGVAALVEVLRKVDAPAEHTREKITRVDLGEIRGAGPIK